MEDPIESVPSPESPAEPARSRDELTARILEFAAFMDEDDHPSVLTDTIAMLIQEIHELRPELQHSTDWLSSENPKTASIQEARWRGATLRSIRELGVEESLRAIEEDRSYRSRLIHRTDGGVSHG